MVLRLADVARPRRLAGEAAASGSDGRLNGDNPYGGMLFTEKNFDVVDVSRSVAGEIGRPMADLMHSQMAIKRDGTSAEVASLVAYLAGFDASGITGAMHTIDGGFAA